MPTFSFTWTDAALFGLTAGLIATIALIGRSSSSQSKKSVLDSSRTNQSQSSKKSKKKNKPKKSPPQPSSQTTIGSNQKSEPRHTDERKASPPKSSNPSPKPISEPKKKKIQQPQIPKLDDNEFPTLANLTGMSAVRAKESKDVPIAERRRANAPKTAVDDMIDEEVEKPVQMARVMAIVEPEPKIILNQESDPEDGWEKVPNSKKPRGAGSAMSTTSSSVSRSAVPKQSNADSSSAASTKRQRQNAKKKEAAKSIKEAEEAERLSRLASYKRQQENERIRSQATGSTKPTGQNSNNPSGAKQDSKLAPNGQLIWE
ncbi:expressed protein [Phakopsora pachyrhizi]|uniref:Expressed protein n=1 Tax=Phakopsora pachyrhizi TaxID=170000 RepID=A0AAV0BR03_PHAPC|nr:expressed protein [Phakopsora pachyrhizi]